MEQSDKPVTPKWGNTTKIIVVVGLLVVAAAVIIRFQSIIPPLILALIIAYLLQPAASFLEQRARMPWGLSVTLIYVVIALVVIGLLILSGYEIIAQAQGFITLIQVTLNQVPSIVNSIQLGSITLGKFTYNLSELGIDLGGLSSQVINSAEPVLGQTGSIIGALASSLFSTIGWLLFILIVSYFLLIESGGLRDQIFTFDLRGFNEDARKFGERLAHIWNAFLRGQLIIFLLAFFIYLVVLNLLGIRYALGLAVVAGLARFLPYIGPTINWMMLGLIAYLQDYKLFGMSPVAYTLLVIACAVIIDYYLDNMVATRIMSHTLKVHAAAIMVAVIIAYEMLGFLGVVIAAPILATVQLVLTYIFRKLNDEDPWPPDEDREPYSIRKQFKDWLQKIRPSRKKTVS